MKQYETPRCEVVLLDEKGPFMADTGASTSGYPVDPVTPFHSRRNQWMEEDDYDE
jgi:hypothetical protein